MSRPITINDTVYSIPVSYDETYQARSVSGLDNALAGSGNTSSYATINLTTGTGAVTLVYYNFALKIPTGATINSINCICRCRINNTQSQRISTREVQLYAGSTPKGTPHDVQNNNDAISITPGNDWTAEEVNNMKIRIHGVRGKNNNTNDYYFWFYGASVSVNYTLNDFEYEVSFQNSSSVVTTEPSTTKYILHGNGQSIKYIGITDINSISIKDNDVDVKNLIEPYQSASTIYSPTSFVGGTLAEISANPPENGLDDVSSTDYAQFRIRGDELYALYAFDTSSIPNNAFIESVSCDVRAYVTDSTYITTKKVQLYSGQEARGVEYTLPTSNQITSITNTGDWDASNIQNIRLRFEATYAGGSNNFYLYFYGASLTVVYGIPGGNSYYLYKIANIQTDHIISISDIVGNEIYLKQNGQYIKGAKLFKKTNNLWVEQMVTLDLFNNGEIIVSQ